MNTNDNYLKLMVKIAKVKSTIGKLAKSLENPFYKSKYFDINLLIEHVEPLLTENGMLLLQPIENGSVISRIVDLETGETFESSLKLPELNDPQKIGSAITFYRRYALQSQLGIQAEDDDANKASGKTDQQKQQSADNRPWLTEKMFKQALEKIKGGDREVLEKTTRAFKIKKEWADQLKAA